MKGSGMAKLLSVQEDDPGVAVTMAWTPPGTPGRAQGWYGSCTECGPDWSAHRWTEVAALETAQRHIDMHQLVHRSVTTEAARLHEGERAATVTEQEGRSYD